MEANLVKMHLEPDLQGVVNASFSPPSVLTTIFCSFRSCLKQLQHQQITLGEFDGASAGGFAERRRAKS